MRTRADYILPFVRGPRVLDGGCAAHEPEPGAPYWLHGQLRRRFPEVIGFDLSQENIEKLRTAGLSNLYVENAETFNLKSQFDTIVAGELIEHLSNPGSFLQRAREHLRPGGRVVLTTPYPFSAYAWIYATFKYPKTCQNPEHTTWFCPRTLAELCKRAGLRISYWQPIEVWRMDCPSWAYRAFMMFLTLFRWLIPIRLRCSAMLYVLEALGEGPVGEGAQQCLAPRGGLEVNGGESGHHGADQGYRCGR